MKGLRIRVTGRVQGVFFRASAKEVADQLGIVGRVRNEPDGTVCIEAEGGEDALGRFVAWCRQGPARAVVADVQVEEAHVQHFKSFQVEGGWR